MIIMQSMNSQNYNMLKCINVIAVIVVKGLCYYALINLTEIEFCNVVLEL